MATLGPYKITNAINVAAGAEVILSGEDDKGFAVFVEPESIQPSATALSATATASQLAALITANANQSPDVLGSLLSSFLGATGASAVGQPILEAIMGVFSGLVGKVDGLKGIVADAVTEAPKSQAAELKARLDALGV